LENFYGRQAWTLSEPCDTQSWSSASWTTSRSPWRRAVSRKSRTMVNIDVIMLRFIYNLVVEVSNCWKSATWPCWL